MTSRLYVIATSHPCHAAERALALKGVEAQRVELPAQVHRLVMRARFGRPSVPGLQLDGERIQGSSEIMRRLDELVPEPPLFPADPEARARVEAAERWGDEVLQPLARRIVIALIQHHPPALVEQARTSTRPGSVALARTIGRPATALVARLWGTNDARARDDVRALPGHLDRVDAWIADGTMGNETPNAADLQIGASLRLISEGADLAPLFEGRPSMQLARRLFPDFRVEVPAGTLPAEWVADAQAGTAEPAAT